MAEGTKPRGLGRGLAALVAEFPGGGTTSVEIEVDRIRPNPRQPRRTFDDAALDGLVESVRAAGLVQPIVVRDTGDGFEIVAGERRWRAAQRAQLHEVPVIVRHLSDAETFELAIIENIQRQELNAIEEAFAYRRLATDYGHKQEAIAQLVGKSRSHVANMLRLLELPDSVRDAVVNGLLSMGHARALVGAADPAALAEEVIRRSLSVRETEKLARAGKAKRAAEPRAAAPEANADIAMLERQLRDQLGLKVDIAHGAKGGAVTIAYATLDQLDMLCQRLSGESF